MKSAWNIVKFRKMDIFEFVEGIHSSSGSVRLAGASFNAHFLNAFGSFNMTPADFVRFSILNFAVQQLSVRSAFEPSTERYFFAGGVSDNDFAASIAGMVPFLRAYLAPASGRGSGSVSAARQITSGGRKDDLKTFEVVGSTPAEFLLREPEASFGLVSLISNGQEVFSREIVPILAASLSPGGTAVMTAASGEIPDDGEGGFSRVYTSPPGTLCPFGDYTLCILRRS